METQDKHKKSINNTRRTIYLGLFIGITIILTRYLNIHITFLTFNGFPIILSGIIFGPLSGAIVGAMSDILGYMLNSFGKPYHPGFTLTAALTGFIPALFLISFQKKNKIPPFWYLTLAILTGQFITKIILIPYFYSHLMGEGIIFIKILEEFFSQLIHIPLYAFLINKILRVYYLS
ncbi:MAG TPA: folate family ECF transporter S component [Candidatus Eremiobacteraeota bacterium]|nr:folate family ECF transporter S component [Candidatus Eremiobacteraeota bacterium]